MTIAQIGYAFGLVLRYVFQKQQKWGNMNVWTRLPHIYDIATSEQNWTTAMDHFCDVGDSRGVAIYASNNTEFDFNLAATNAFYSAYPEEVTRYLTKFRHYDEQSVPYIIGCNPFRFVADEEIWPNLDVVKGRDDIYYLRDAFGVDRRGGINISGDPSWHAVLSFQFGLGNNNPLQLEKSDVEFLSRHLGKAVEINRFCSQLRRRYNAVLSVLDHINVGLCVALKSGEVIARNRQAARIFEGRDGISLDLYNHIKLKEDIATAALRQFIQDCAGTATGEGDTIDNMVLSNRLSNKDPYLIEVSPLRDGDDELNDNVSGALVMIVDPADPPDISSQAMSELFKLSNAETEIASLLLDGKSTQEIADVRAVTINTAKNQCKAIYAKTGVCNRVQLVRKAVSISPPIK